MTAHYCHENAVDPQAKEAMMADWTMFAGTYTRTGRSKGIYSFSVDSSTGTATQTHVTEGISNPSYVAVHQNKKNLYAVAEVEESSGVPGGALFAYSIDSPDGKLTRLNQQSTGGPGPCHVSIDATGKFAIVANYGGGSICVLPIDDDGSLKPYSQFIQHHGGTKVNERRQEKAHAHSINIAPDNRKVIVADLGMDQLRVYDFDQSTGNLTFNEEASAASAPGGGPRHFEFHENGKWAYAINELGCTVTAYQYDAASGKLSEINTLSTLPEDYDGQNTTADIHIHPNGKFVYGSNRGHNTLAIFSINDRNGSVKFVGDQSTGGKTPRNFSIHPDGKFLYAANQDTDNILQFEVNGGTGELEPVQEIKCPMPVCLKFADLG